MMATDGMCEVLKPLVHKGMRATTWSDTPREVRAHPRGRSQEHPLAIDDRPSAEATLVRRHGDPDVRPPKY